MTKFISWILIFANCKQNFIAWYGKVKSCLILENLQQIEKLKNKDIRILLDKIVRKYGGKVVNK